MGLQLEKSAEIQIFAWISPGNSNYCDIFWFKRI